MIPKGSPRAGVPSRAVGRIPVVDVVRGIAIAGVVLFHLVWDLAFLDLTSPALAANSLWLAFGRVLAGTFMLLVGVSLVLATHHGLDRVAFKRRLAVLALAAMSITIVTWLAFPETFVYFGILHAIAVASLVGLPLLHLGTTTVALVGMAMVALGFFVSTSAFDPRWLSWVGFAAAPAPANDFVPVFPWIGFSVLGIVLARIGLAQGWMDVLPAFDGRIGRSFAALGRWSLPIYLIHQPVLLFVLTPVSWVASG